MEQYKTNSAEVSINNNMLTLTIHTELASETGGELLLQNEEIITGMASEKPVKKQSAQVVDFGSDITKILTTEFETKTAKIRALWKAGMEKTEIANQMGCRYQQVRQALVTWKEYNP